MITNKAVLIAKIQKQLIVFEQYVADRNAEGFSDASKESEDLFCGLLNLVLKKKLINENIFGGVNTDTIDLSDADEKLCVQVTSNKAAAKISGTLEAFDQKKLSKKFQRIIFLVVAQKKYRTKFKSKTINFNQKDDIMTTRDLIKKINGEDVGLVKLVSDYLDENLPKDIAVVSPTKLYDDDIKEILRKIFDFVGKNFKKNEDQAKQYKFQMREDGFITKKNAINNLSDDDFNLEVMPSIQHQKTISQFLTNPINAKEQVIYFEITSTIQKEYLENASNYSGIDDVFRIVFDGVINYRASKKIDSNKLKVVLYNMYFNCDIGTNPK
ncbi:MAG: ABC-three component system protein [Patescibacteria group bacterium]